MKQTASYSGDDMTNPWLDRRMARLSQLLAELITDGTITTMEQVHQLVAEWGYHLTPQDAEIIKTYL